MQQLKQSRGHDGHHSNKHILMTLWEALSCHQCASLLVVFFNCSRIMCFVAFMDLSICFWLFLQGHLRECSLWQVRLEQVPSKGWNILLSMVTHSKRVSIVVIHCLLTQRHTTVLSTGLGHPIFLSYSAWDLGVHIRFILCQGSSDWGYLFSATRFFFLNLEKLWRCNSACVGNYIVLLFVSIIGFFKKRWVCG